MPTVTYSPMSEIDNVYLVVFAEPADGILRTLPIPSKSVVMVALDPVSVVMLADVEPSVVIVPLV